MDPDDLDAELDAAFADEAELDAAFEAPEGVTPPGTAELPPGQRETGERNIVHELPAFRMSAGGGMEQAPGATGAVFEERTIEKAPSAHDVAPGTQIGPDLRTSAQQLEGFQRDTLAGMTGRSPITAATIRRAAEVLRNSDANTATGQSFESLGNALGTLMPTAPMPPGMESQPDRRPQAIWRGANPWPGTGDEMGALLGGVTRPWLGERGGSDVLHAQPPATYETRRDALRQEMAQSEAQAPEGHALGQLMGSAPMALLPGGQATAAGRIGATAGFGAAAGGLRGAGESEAETPGGVALDAATGAGVEGAAAGLMGGAGEVVGPALRWAQRTAARQAIPTRLEATGFWGGAAMQAADDLPGGQAGLAADLRRTGIGHDVSGPSGRRSLFPRPENVADDAQELREAAGRRIGEVVAEMDAAGTPGGLRDAAAGGVVDLSTVADEMEAVARELEALPSGGAEVARAIREVAVEPFRGRRLSFSDAHAQRQLFDDRIRSWARSADPNLTTAGGRLQTARQSVSRAMDEAARRMSPEMFNRWRRANRDFSIARFVQQRGRGAERQSVMGGLPGAIAAGADISTGGAVGAVRGVASREIAQQQRRMWPGVRTAGLEAVAETLGALNTPAGRRYAAVLERARNGVGLPAAHFLLMRTRPDYRALFDESNVDSGEQPQEQQP